MLVRESKFNITQNIVEYLRIARMSQGIPTALPVATEYPSKVRTIWNSPWNECKQPVEIIILPRNAVNFLSKDQWSYRCSHTVMVGLTHKQNKPINKMQKCPFVPLWFILSLTEIQIVCTNNYLFVQQCFVFIPACIRIKRSVISCRQIRRRANARNVSYTPYPTGDKHTISTLLIKPIFSVLAHAEK